MMADSL